MSSNTNKVLKWPVIDCRKDFEVDGRAFKDLEDRATADGDTKGCFEKATLQTYEGCYQLLDGVKPNDWKPSWTEDFMKRLPTTLAEIQKQVEISSLLKGQKAKCEMTRKEKEGRYFDIDFNYDELDYLLKKMEVKKYEFHTCQTAFFETFTSLLVGISLYDNVEEKFKLSNDETKVSFLIEFAATKCVMKTLANYAAYCFHQWKIDCEKKKAEAEKKKALAKMKANHENHLVKLKEEHKKDVEQKLSDFDEEMKQAMAEMKLAMQKQLSDFQLRITDGREKVQKECENAYMATVESAVDEFEKQEQALSKNENANVDEDEEEVIDVENANVDEDVERTIYDILILQITNDAKSHGIELDPRDLKNMGVARLHNWYRDVTDGEDFETIPIDAEAAKVKIFEAALNFVSYAHVPKKKEAYETLKAILKKKDDGEEPEVIDVEDGNVDEDAERKKAEDEAAENIEVPQVASKQAAQEMQIKERQQKVRASNVAAKRREKEAAEAQEAAKTTKKKRKANGSHDSPRKVRVSARKDKGVPESRYGPVLKGKICFEDTSRKGLGSQKRAKPKNKSPCEVHDLVLLSKNTVSDN
jgi:disulfide oxidoreductase YuzD